MRSPVLAPKPGTLLSEHVHFRVLSITEAI